MLPRRAFEIVTVIRPNTIEAEDLIADRDAIDAAELERLNVAVADAVVKVLAMDRAELYIVTKARGLVQ